MGSVPRSIQLTIVMIVTLATAEAVLAWRYLRPGAESEAVLKMRRELREKTAEINRLILRQEADRREVLRTSAARPESVQQAQVRSYPRPAGRLGEELADVALTVPDADDLNEPGSQEEGHAIDARHLVNMANIMTGKNTARLTQLGSETAIHYKGLSLAESDPIWTVLDAVSQAQALRRILLVSNKSTDSLKLKRLKQDLVQFGLPERLISVSAGESQNQNLEGVVISITATTGGT